MVLFFYHCEECNHKQEHSVTQKTKNQLTCPSCGSSRYTRRLSRIKVDMYYTDQQEFMEKTVQPHVDEAYEKMGREAMNEDTKTAENLFGTDKVERTLGKFDE